MFDLDFNRMNLVCLAETRSVFYRKVKNCVASVVNLKANEMIICLIIFFHKNVTYHTGSSRVENKRKMIENNRYNNYRDIAIWTCKNSLKSLVLLTA